ncbi:hypothetical protein GGX14DRAFT_424117 [Mycena pura]|uniref:RanBD1 domain-containing protein n=1 Tax=Mycena pura TaxID=153505 RepID=A0AAD7E1Q5_9AGAR|nr:hypothetical protein GGX14DRAFT_424117 [Mycena pura]
MSDTHHSPPSTSVLDSPPPSPQSPANSDTDAKSSRKREREASQEPATTPQATADADPLAREYKEAQTPAKKNRRYLDSTAEEDDSVITRSGSQSPAPGEGADMSVSPPHEMKIRVRQISQGVEDLGWQNMQNASPEKAREAEGLASVDNDSHLEDVDIIDPANDATEIKVDAEEPRPSPPDAAVTVEDVQGSMSFVQRRDSDSDLGEKEKGLKRKYLERGTSTEPTGPQERGDGSEAPAEPLKRPRDDPDKEGYPREPKRPSPPPVSTRKSPTMPSPKISGFMAYASTSSPFAAVKGENVFASKKTTMAPFQASATPSAGSSTSPSPFLAAVNEPSTPPSSTKRSVFGASSPFAASTKAKQDVLGSSSKFGRAKSPPRRVNPSGSSAFSAYASGGVQGFALPMQKRAQSPDGSGASSLERGAATAGGTATNGSTDSGGEDDDRPATFGEKLRASKDEEEGKSDEEDAKQVLTEQEFTTGEEDEETLHQVRAKLFILVEGSQWKERGTGMLKLNVRRSDGGGARLIMRKEAVYTVLLNVTLFRGMRCTLAQDPRYLRIGVLEGGAATHYNVRVSSAKAAQDLINEINANLPPA